MDQDLLGTRRLGVVRDDFDRHQVSGTVPRRLHQAPANGAGRHTGKAVRLAMALHALQGHACISHYVAAWPFMPALPGPQNTRPTCFRT